MTRTHTLFHPAALIVAALAAAPALPAWAQAPAGSADALIQQVSTDVLAAIKADKAVQAGDLAQLAKVVDSKVMPHVDFVRMTAAVVGRPWRSATPEQKQRLQAEFNTLLMRTYSGALKQVKDQTIAMLPQRAPATETDLVVRTQVRGGGEPVQLDYRVSKTAAGWKIYDINVLGVWLGDQYRSNFAPVISAKGLDGLIADLAARNQGVAAK